MALVLPRRIWLLARYVVIAESRKLKEWSRNSLMAICPYQISSKSVRQFSSWNTHTDIRTDRQEEKLDEPHKLSFYTLRAKNTLKCNLILLESVWLKFNMFSTRPNRPVATRNANGVDVMRGRESSSHRGHSCFWKETSRVRAHGSFSSLRVRPTVKVSSW
jgi:hypothetical protein